MATAIRESKRMWLLAPLVLAVLAVSLAGVWAFGGDDDTPRVGEPAEVSTEELRSLARSKNQSVYWAGRAPGDRYELTETKSGAIYVRYLPAQARIGDRRPAFTTVATYPLLRAYERTARSGERNGAVQRDAPGGGIAVWNERRPTSVYLAYPGSDLLVEVFSPDTGRAQELALEGDVGPIR